MRSYANEKPVQVRKLISEGVITGPTSGPLVVSMRPIRKNQIDQTIAIPVFWACGVTPQAAVENAKPELMITHSPGHMFIADLKNEDLKGMEIS